MKLEEFESANYAVIIAPNTGGCWFIRRLADGFESYLETCSEGMQAYRDLKRGWRKNRAIFDSMCAEYTFSPIN